MKLSELSIDQQQRLVKSYWRFDGIDVSDISDDIRIQFWEGLAKGKSVAKAMGTESEAISMTDVTRSRSALPALVMTAICACILLGSVWSIRAVHAQRIRVNHNRQFTQSVADLLLDVYEENPVRTAGLLDQVDMHFPAHALENRGSDETKIHACRIAIRCLLDSREGHAGNSMNRLAMGTRVLEKEGPSEIDLLDFLFLLTTGKAALEANDLLAHSYERDQGQKTEIKKFDESLAQALLLLEGGLQGDWTQDEICLLKASLSTDLARWNFRYGTKLPSEKIELGTLYLDQARKLLEQVESREGHYHLASARELNNRILLLQRRQTLGDLKSQNEFDEAFDLMRSELERVCSFQPDKEDPKSPAIWFEQAICYSNLADVIYDRVAESGEFATAEWAGSLRNRAVELLSKIPFSARTERAFENHLINRVRPIVEQICFQNNTSNSDEIRIRANEIDKELGGVFENRIGQFPVYHRLAIASVLPEKYSNQEVIEIASQQLNLFKNSKSHRELQKWLEKLILAKSSVNRSRG